MIEKAFSYITQNKEWIFSGIGVLAISAVIGLLRLAVKKKSPTVKQTLKQINKKNAKGTQIGIQINRDGETARHGEGRK